MGEFYQCEVTLSDGSTATVTTPRPLSEDGKAKMVRLLEKQKAGEKVGTTLSEEEAEKLMERRPDLHRAIRRASMHVVKDDDT